MERLWRGAMGQGGSVAVEEADRDVMVGVSRLRNM